MNVVLVGMMASGKSTVGRLLAKALGRPFIDTDAWIEEQTGRTVAEMFAAEGEAGFREREAEAIRGLSARSGLVIATGGGAVLRPANRVALREGGRVFWLDAPVELLYERAMRAGPAKRPLLAHGDALERLRTIAGDRAEAYTAAAHHRIDVADLQPPQVVRIIMDTLKGDQAYATRQRKPRRPKL